MKFFGYILFILGIILSSIFAAPEKPLWGYFFLFIFFAIIGAFLVRFDKRSRSLTIGKDTEEESVTEISLYICLNSIIQKTIKLSKLIKNSGLNNIDIKKDIKEIQEIIKYFIDYQYILQDRHGIKNISHLYSSFAGGERYLLRAWSALVDGYIDEMNNSLKQSADRFINTSEILKDIIKID